MDFAYPAMHDGGGGGGRRVYRFTANRRLSYKYNPALYASTFKYVTLSSRQCVAIPALV